MSTELHLDSSMGVMEETRFRKKFSAVIKKLAKEYHFSYTEVESLCIIYYKLQLENKGRDAKAVTKDQLVQFFHNTLDMTETQMIHQVIYAALGKGTKQALGMEDWIRYLSLLLRSTMDEKIKHCFSTYDIMMAGKLSRDGMIALLSHAIISEEGTDNEDVVKDLVEILTKKLDLDRDGKISFDDFKDAILKTPLLLECLGPCLPSRLAIRSFLGTFTRNVGKF